LQGHGAALPSCAPLGRPDAAFIAVFGCPTAAVSRKTPIILRCRSGLLHLPALRSVASLIKPLIPDEKPCLHPHRTSRDFAAPANGSNASCNEYICRQRIEAVLRTCCRFNLLLAAQIKHTGAD
jgi:hypothetical protein